MSRKKEKLDAKFSHARRGVLGRIELDARSFFDVQMIGAVVQGSPVGTVYYQFICSGWIEILDSYVTHWAREAGVRTLIHKHMLQSYNPPVVVTGRGSCKAARKWLKKNGFVRREGGWIAHRPASGWDSVVI